MSFSCLTWNRGKPCIFFDVINNCCSDPVEYIHAENKLPVCRYHQNAVERKTSDEEKNVIDYTAALEDEIRQWSNGYTGLFKLSESEITNLGKRLNAAIQKQHCV